jgi:hypothetical protein
VTQPLFYHRDDGTPIRGTKVPNGLYVGSHPGGSMMQLSPLPTGTQQNAALHVYSLAQEYGLYHEALQATQDIHQETSQMLTCLSYLGDGPCHR